MWPIKNVSAWWKKLEVLTIFINHNVHHFKTPGIHEYSELPKNSCTTGHT
jgi:hypothetical protein